jgi:hypothetical protein
MILGGAGGEDALPDPRADSADETSVQRGNNNSGVRGRVICEFARDTSDNRGREQGTNGRSSHHRLICALV